MTLCTGGRSIPRPTCLLRKCDICATMILVGCKAGVVNCLYRQDVQALAPRHFTSLLHSSIKRYTRATPNVQHRDTSQRQSSSYRQAIAAKLFAFKLRRFANCACTKPVDEWDDMRLSRR
jgi:hypothetical protein